MNSVKRFEQDKTKTLEKMQSNDKSNKGSVDKPVLGLINKINKSNNFYTTSSCSGRIIVLFVPDSGSKKDAEFIFRTHDLVDKKSISLIKQSLNYSNDKYEKGSIWFRQEPCILHIAAREMGDASNLLRLVREIGFKRSGLFEVEKRLLMELMSTEKIDTILFKDGKRLVDDDYIDVLVAEANKRLKRTWEKTKKLEKQLKEII